MLSEYRYVASDDVRNGLEGLYSWEDMHSARYATSSWTPLRVVVAQN